MKNIIILLFLFLKLVGLSQNFDPVVLNLNENFDFSFLKKELKETKIVMLGEATHNDGNIFELKTSIIKYLHQEMGFNVIAFEAGTFDIWKAQREIKKNTDTRIAIENSLFSIWSKAKEFESFISFFDKNKSKLKIFGFDNQITGAYGEKELLKELYHYCQINHFIFDLNQSDFELLLESIFYSGVFDEKDISYQEYKSSLILLQKNILEKKTNEDHFYWLQIVNNLISLGDEYYYSKNQIINSFNVNYEDNARDKQMAKNLLNYIKVHPNEKIICWGANNHFVNDMLSVTTPILKDFKSMGSYLKNKLKRKLYSLAIVTAEDSINLAGKYYKSPIDSSSFEAYLKKIQSPYAFISSNQKAMKLKIKNRLFSPITFVNAKLNLLHDGYIYVDKAIPSNFRTSNKDKIRKNVIKKNKITNNISGYIKDKQTKKPLEFVNILINGSNLSAVTDENGYFELILPFNLNYKSINISSIGYKGKTYLLNKVPHNIELENESIELEEVVIHKKISANTIIKNVIKNVKKNYSMKPFNSTHFANAKIKTKDSTLLNVDIVTNQYNRGYSNRNRPTQNIQEIRWNIKKITPPQKIRQLFNGEYNPVKDANFLNKRKRKKFQFSIENEKNHNKKDIYVIKFVTNRNHFTYTSQIFSSDYFGYIYINKDDFAIIKVIENWNIIDYPNELLYSNKFWQTNYSSKITSNVTLESNYIKHSNNLYYLQKSINHTYGTLEDKNQNKSSFQEVYTSYWYNFKDKELNRISFKNEKTELEKVSYNKTFWDTYKFLKQ